MSTIIIYGSQYGTTESYARKLSEMTGFSLINYKDIKDLSSYDTIIHFGGLYAGGVKGLKNTVKALPENARLFIVTVGLADVNDRENTDNIKDSIGRHLPEKIFSSATIFHLRGGIDYQKLNFKHKTMMTLLYNKAKNLPEEQKTAEVKAMIETFNKKVNFVDYSALNQIVDAVK
ncbi:MAG: flavodoxin domain-containing protein [Ruminococcus sp.]